MAPSGVSSVRVRVSIGPPRCPVNGRASSTLRLVDALFVAACGVVGAAVGGLLDPVSQQLADRSRAAEEQDRAERAARRVSEAGATTGASLTPEAASPMAVPELGVDTSETDDLDAAPSQRHLLPTGRSTGR